jgi:hypothetical protein
VVSKEQSWSPDLDCTLELVIAETVVNMLLGKQTSSAPTSGKRVAGGVIRDGRETDKHFFLVAM